MTTAAFVSVVTLAYPATFSLTTAHLGAAALSTPVMYPLWLVSTNGFQNTGKIEKNDTMTLIWSKTVDQPTLCSSWSNATTHTLNMNWVVQNGTGAGGDDVLVPSTTGGTCSSGMHAGSVDLGAPGYVNGSNVTISNVTTALSFSGGATLLKLTVPNNSFSGGTLGTVASGSAAVWTPDAAVTDLSGNSCGANLAMSSATVQF